MFDDSPAPRDGGLGLGAKLLILLMVAAAYGSNFWPGRLILREGSRALHLGAYERWGVFLPHLLLYSTLMAAVSAVLWWALVRTRLLEPPRFGNLRQSAILGAAGGVAVLAVTLAVAQFTFPAGTIHWIAPNPWKIAGNIFSNFYEEFVFRGFLLVALNRLVGFWPAAILSSAMWAFLHTQYPLAGQLDILAAGVVFSWLARRANSLLAPYIGHEVLDIIGDSLIG